MHLSNTSLSLSFLEFIEFHLVVEYYIIGGPKQSQYTTVVHGTDFESIILGKSLVMPSWIQYI